MISLICNLKRNDTDELAAWSSVLRKRSKSELTGRKYHDPHKRVCSSLGLSFPREELGWGREVAQRPSLVFPMLY